MPRIFNLSLIAALAMLLNACADNDDPGPQQPPLIDIVEIAGIQPAETTFTLFHNGDHRITLSAAATLDNRFSVGDAIVINYTPISGQPYTSGPIRLHWVAKIPNISLTYTDNVDLYDDTPLHLLSVWRAGTRLNIRCLLPAKADDLAFGVLVDNASLSTTTPRLYLATTYQAMPEQFDRECYVSCDISSLLANPDYTAIDIHVANDNLQQNLFTIPLR